jgi:hypothetical protein
MIRYDGNGADERKQQIMKIYFLDLEDVLILWIGLGYETSLNTFNQKSLSKKLWRF